MSTMISRTQTAGTNPKKLTVSFWMKPAALGTTRGIWGCGTGTGDAVSLHYLNTDQFSFETYDGSSNPKLKPYKLFRDPAAWYHVVCSIDTTDTTANDRLKLYVNGERLTSLQNNTTITQDSDIPGWSGSGDTLKIGNRILDGDAYFKGSLTHFHIIDGTIYTPTDFAETDSTSGIWKPKANPSVTYGTNGGFYKFENSGAMGTDSSGQSNNCSVSGTLTQNVDTPTNNYATLTPLYTIEYNSSQFFTNGNNTTNSNTTQWNTNPCTMEVSSGKWYFEGYGHTNGSNYVHYGITSSAKMNANATQAQSEINTNSNGYAYGYYGTNGSIYYSTTSASSSTSYGNSYGSTDYIGIFADLDNNKLYFAKNGTLQNSGTGYDISADGKPYILATAVYSGLTNVNFGSGVFGTTALTGTTYADANGHGTFKYSPNQGGAANFDSATKNFYAMNTKNLKEFG